VEVVALVENPGASGKQSVASRLKDLAGSDCATAQAAVRASNATPVKVVILVEGPLEPERTRAVVKKNPYKPQFLPLGTAAEAS